MASELRWILLALSAVLLVGIWWWGRRRSKALPGNAQLRETGAGPTLMGPTLMGQVSEDEKEHPESREWGVPPFEPLNIRTADFDQAPMIDLPMSATADPLDLTLNMDDAGHESALHAPIAESEFMESPLAEMLNGAPTAGVQGEVHGSETHGSDAGTDVDTRGGEARASEEAYGGTLRRDEAASHDTRGGAVHGDTAPVSGAVTPNTSEMQRIVTVRVCAAGDAHWPGAGLLAALETQGLGYGRYKVFHRKHSDGRTLFCVASLVEPGTFDIVRMPDESFRGLTLFAVLPGPADALETIDTLIATAVDLADTLHGVVQDARGAPLSAQRAEALREEVAEFQRSLPVR